MTWYRVNKCCCGCSLRKGAISIGLIFGMINILLTAGLGSFAENEISQKGIVTEVSAATLTLALLTISVAICNILLAIGASQERTSLLMLWMVADVINLATVLGIYGTVFVAIIGYGNDATMALVMIALWMIVIICIYIYSFLIVYSYYRTLIESGPKMAPLPREVNGVPRRWK